ncbi:MAG TPA: Fur family transcriptional regulator [Parasegetibacter sp.]|jgi:Fur family ferric uptake transcriptional regulator
MKSQVLNVLKDNHLNITGSRTTILELFLQQEGALSHADIEKKIDGQFDRVTIYRTLQTFMDKGIIHTIPTAENATLYALCKDNCTAGHHHDNHVHFVCDKCGTTICLDNVAVPEIRLPSGFTHNQTDVLVNGICKNCKKS